MMMGEEMCQPPKNASRQLSLRDFPPFLQQLFAFILDLHEPLSYTSPPSLVFSGFENVQLACVSLGDEGLPLGSRGDGTKLQDCESPARF